PGDRQRPRQQRRTDARDSGGAAPRAWACGRLQTVVSGPDETEAEHAFGARARRGDRDGMRALIPGGRKEQPRDRLPAGMRLREFWIPRTEAPGGRAMRPDASHDSEPDVLRERRPWACPRTALAGPSALPPRGPCRLPDCLPTPPPGANTGGTIPVLRTRPAFPTVGFMDWAQANRSGV